MMKTYRLSNKNGMQVEIWPFGAVIQKILLPQPDGSHVDVVHGYDTVEGYKDDKVHFGCITGRFANRISNAKFTLDNQEYNLTCNRMAGPHKLCLHGGKNAFNKYMWHVIDSSSTSVSLEMTSPDGDEGFPGEVHVRIDYCLNDLNELHLRYKATTSKTTVITLTNHSYFNLAGHKAKSILNHELQAFSDYYLPKGPNECPNGEVAACTGIYDFKKPKKLGDHIDEYPEEPGVSTFYLVKDWKPSNGCNECKPLMPAARVVEPESGRWLFVKTNEPLFVVYSADHLNVFETKHPGKEGVRYENRSAFCIETQGYPDAPNFPHFPTTTLRPGEQYSHHTVWQFGEFENTRSI